MKNGKEKEKRKKGGASRGASTGGRGKGKQALQYDVVTVSLGW